MHLACCRRIQFPSPVIKPECHVGRFLDFSNQKSAVSSVHSTWSNIDYIAFFRFYHIQKFLSRAVLASVIELLRRNLTLESAIHLRPRLGIHDIPYLCLTERIISLYRHLIVRMHLHRQLVIYIKELDQKRKLTAIPLVHVLTHNSFEISLHKFTHGISCKPSVRNHRILRAHISKLPALTQKHIRTDYRLVAFFVTLDELLS